VWRRLDRPWCRTATAATTPRRPSNPTYRLRESQALVSQAPLELMHAHGRANPSASHERVQRPRMYRRSLPVPRRTALLCSVDAPRGRSTPARCACQAAVRRVWWHTGHTTCAICRTTAALFSMQPQSWPEPYEGPISAGWLPHQRLPTRCHTRSSLTQHDAHCAPSAAPRLPRPQLGKA
jgi:hypothetical protein